MERTDLASRWTALFGEYEVGTQTRTEFCTARRLKVSTFDYWRRRLKAIEGMPKAVKVATVGRESSAIRILVGDAVRIELDGSCEAEQIRRVVEAVRRL